MSGRAAGCLPAPCTLQFLCSSCGPPHRSIPAGNRHWAQSPSFIFFWKGLWISRYIRVLTALCGIHLWTHSASFSLKLLLEGLLPFFASFEPPLSGKNQPHLVALCTESCKSQLHIACESNRGQRTEGFCLPGPAEGAPFWCRAWAWRCTQHKGCCEAPRG